jgi:inorganic triphosphatase YgiF
MSAPLETELKLELSFDQARLDLSAMNAKSEGSAKSLISTYYDTPDRKLRDAGYSLRVRECGGHHIQTVKAQANAAAGWYVRPEWEQQIPGPRPVLAQAGPLMQEIGADVLGGLRRAFVTEVERKVHKVRIYDSTILVADDSGEVRAGRHAEPIREVELELEKGNPRAIFTLAKRLCDDFPVRLGVRSKSERGYSLLDRRGKPFKSEPVALAPNDNTADAFDKIAQSCIRQYRLNETLLLAKGEPEALHQARVGLRRLRSAFSLFAPLFAADDRAQLLRAELRWLAISLGEVRDIDVLIPHLSGDKRVAMAAERKVTFARVMEEVDSARTRLLMLDLAEWLPFGAWRERPADPSLLDRGIASTARDILETRRKKLKRRGRKLLDLPDAERHELRKQAKKLRYATEFFATLFPDHRHFLAKLQTLQDELGELNDLATFPELLARHGIHDETLAEGGNRADLLDRTHRAYLDFAEQKRFWE